MNVFIYRDISTYKNPLIKLIQSKLHLKYGNYCVDHLDEYTNKDMEQIKNILNFDFIEIYHGCRTDNVKNYYEHGILNYSTKDKINNLLKICKEEKLDATYYMKIVKEKMALHNELDNKKCYCVLDNLELENDSGHYVKYGSEWLSIVLMDQRHILLKRGQPTIFKIHMPINEFFLDKNTLISFIDALSILYENDYNLYDLIFALTFKKKIPASWIKDHYHLKKINFNYF